MKPTIDHDDPEVQRMFDIELAGGAAVLKALICSDYDYDYAVGILGAMYRNPTPEQKLMHDLAARVDERGQLPPDTPEWILETALDPLGIANKIKLLAYLVNRERLVPVPVPVRSVP